MEKYIAVAIGGAVGALCRMALGEWVMTKVSSFPYGTVVVNLIGCFIIGLVLGLYMQKPDLSQLARFFLVVGGLGAFTTFSTFAFEMLQLMMTESYVQAFFYGCTSCRGLNPLLDWCTTCAYTRCNLILPNKVT